MRTSFVIEDGGVVMRSGGGGMLTHRMRTSDLDSGHQLETSNKSAACCVCLQVVLRTLMHASER